MCIRDRSYTDYLHFIIVYSGTVYNRDTVEYTKLRPYLKLYGSLELFEQDVPSDSVFLGHLGTMTNWQWLSMVPNDTLEANGHRDFRVDSKEYLFTDFPNGIWYAAGIR